VKSLTVLATATFILALSSLSVFATELTGQASIIDGDTLEIHGTRISPLGH
jgi:endonuclease YncB( thermonuclease family)